MVYLLGLLDGFFFIDENFDSLEGLPADLSSYYFYLSF
jgi:hypothetical protein